MLEKHRQQSIKIFLEKQQFASIKELSSEFKASEATIRRDIVKMSNRGEIQKIRGGAESIKGSLQKQSATTPEVSTEDTNALGTRKAIAQCAVNLCHKGEPIVISASSLTYLMGEHLTGFNLNILTDSLALATYLNEQSDNQISLPGGEIYRNQGIIVNAVDNAGTDYFQGNLMFMGCQGLGKYGVMVSDLLFVRSGHRLKRQAMKLVVLAESAVLNKRSDYVFCPLTDIDVLITDSSANPDLVNHFEQNDIDVMIVDAVD